MNGVAIDVDAGVLEAMRANSGAIRLLIVSRDEGTRGALHDALRRIFEIHHPEEPDDPFASWAGPVERIGDGWVLALDMADAEAYEGILEAVLRSVVEALEAAGVSEAVVTAAPRGAVAHPPPAPTSRRTVPPIWKPPETATDPPTPLVPARQALDWLAREAVPGVLRRIGIGFDPLPPLTQPFELTAVARSLSAAVSETFERVEEPREERIQAADETAAQERINGTVAQATCAAADWSHRTRLWVLGWRSMLPAGPTISLDTFVLMSAAAEMATFEWTTAWREVAGIELDPLQPPALGYALAPFVYGQGRGSPVAAARSNAPDAVPGDVEAETLSAVEERLTRSLPALVEPYARSVVAAFADVAVQYGFLLLAPEDKLGLAEELTTSWDRLVSDAAAP
jgi:hypothetical protein